MNTTIGIYTNHETAVDAVIKLKESGFPVEHLTIMGKAETEDVDKNLHITTHNPVNVTGLAAGTAVGTALGVLTGVGLLAIPGVGFLYGAGALVGAIGGLDFGIMGGGLATVLTSLGVKDENAKKYHDALDQGKFLLIAHGDKEIVNDAKKRLTAIGRNEDVASHL